jgi:hypothetical protein
MRRTVLLIAGVPLLVLLVLLVVAQLVLPGIAAQRLRDRLARSGTVLGVEVDAFPAIELLWHQADHVVVRMGSYRSSAATLNSTVGQIGNVATLDASAEQFSTGLLTVRNAAMRKRGNQLSATATVTETDLRSALPVLNSVQPVGSSGGQITLRGTATVLGVPLTVDASVRPQNGALIVSPNVPFGALATITLFSNSAIFVQGVAAAPASGGFTVSAQALVR